MTNPFVIAIRTNVMCVLLLSGLKSASVGAQDVQLAAYENIVARLVDSSLRFHLWMGFSKEMELRRHSFSGFSADAGRTVGVFTLW